MLSSTPRGYVFLTVAWEILHKTNVKLVRTVTKKTIRVAGVFFHWETSRCLSSAKWNPRHERQCLLVFAIKEWGSAVLEACSPSQFHLVCTYLLVILDLLPVKILIKLAYSVKHTHFQRTVPLELYRIELEWFYLR